MKQRCALFILLMAGGLASQGKAQPRDQSLGHLTLRLTGSDGSDIPEGTLTITSDRGTVMYHSLAKGEVQIDLPFGKYRADFRSDFLMPASTELVVAQRDVFVVLAAQFDVGNLHLPADHFAISLRIEPHNSCSGTPHLWVRIAGVFLDYTADTEVNAEGYALFDPVPRGTYTISVVDGALVRVVQPVRTFGPVTTVSLNLPQCSRGGQMK